MICLSTVSSSLTQEEAQLCFASVQIAWSLFLPLHNSSRLGTCSWNFSVLLVAMTGWSGIMYNSNQGMTGNSLLNIPSAGCRSHDIALTRLLPMALTHRLTDPEHFVPELLELTSVVYRSGRGNTWWLPVFERAWVLQLLREVYVKSSV